jgi:predicted phosphoadenosine phosphosulfate sulfurtransferase
MTTHSQRRYQMKTYLEKDVLEAARDRISSAFDDFESIYISFSGGKDSTVMLHLMVDECKKRNRKIGCLIVDLEAQYKLTMDHVSDCVSDYSDYLDVFWCCLPIKLRNAVSVYQPTWKCWDGEKKDEWVRSFPKNCISDVNYFDFFQDGMEFEEFVPLFGEWYSKGRKTACFVGIRSDESLNRYRTIASKSKKMHKNQIHTTLVTDNVYNIYPIYDWRTEDIWRYTSKSGKRMNGVYQRFYLANVPLSHMRICQPYGDDQRRGLWLFHLLEPETWSLVVKRVSGVNSGSLYIGESGNINGYGKVTKPKDITWKRYCEVLLLSLPPVTKNHYIKRFNKFIRWWKARGYQDGIPDEAPNELEVDKLVPSYKRICKSILRNDWWCKGLSFTQPKSEAFEKYKRLKKEKELEIL